MKVPFTLTQAGYLVIKASDGPSAVRRLEEESPDLVVLDINMPGLTGFQVCEAIRKCSRIPGIAAAATGSS
ncbi:MAG TPA: response regulator [Steroidobacteraceae bacterium]